MLASGHAEQLRDTEKKLCRSGSEQLFRLMAAVDLHEFCAPVRQWDEQLLLGCWPAYRSHLPSSAQIAAPRGRGGGGFPANIRPPMD